MEPIVLIAAVILMTGIGTRVIHLLNAQHDARTTAYRRLLRPLQREHANVKYIETQISPSLGHAEVRIIAHTPEAARAVAEALRHCFAGAEQRSYPGLDGDTRLHLTVDTATPAGPARSWLATSRTPVGAGIHSDET